MRKHFLSSITNLREGRIWTLVTPCFSQRDLGHFALNMFVLYSFGSHVWSHFINFFWKINNENNN